MFAQKSKITVATVSLYNEAPHKLFDEISQKADSTIEFCVFVATEEFHSMPIIPHQLLPLELRRRLVVSLRCR